MKKIKVIIIISILIILSGCSNVTSNVNVNKDGSVSENVYIEAINDEVGSNKEKVKENLEYAVNNYNDVLKFRNYEHNIEVGDNTSNVVIKNEFKNICDYFEKTLFTKYVYNKIKCTETDQYYEIQNITEHIDYCGGCSDWPSLDNVKLNINLPIAAEENNADEVENGTYTWNFDKTTTNDKGLYLKINKNQLQEKIKQNKKEEKIEIKKEKGKKSITTVIILGVVIAIIMFFVVELKKKYESNKVDY